MRQLSESMNILLQCCRELRQSHWWPTRRRYRRQMIELLSQVSVEGDPVAAVYLLHLLFTGDEMVRVATCRAVSSILTSIEPQRLLDVAAIVGQEYSYYESVEWNDLRPPDLDKLASEPSSRASILGLASFHRNGYIRQQAVRLLAGVRDGSELPYLLLRLNDWVEPVSEDAHAVVAERLTPDYLRPLCRNLPLVVHLLQCGRYDHSATIRQVVELLTRPESYRFLLSAVESPQRAVRRTIVKVALGSEMPRRCRVVELGLQSDDAILRLWCSRHLRSCVGGDELTAAVHRLKTDGSLPVRREALLMEASMFPESVRDIWREALFDPKSTIRDLARIRLRKAGETDLAPIYRDRLRQEPGSVPSILGLSETGDESDLRTIRPYLTHRLPSRRMAGVRALAHLGKQTVIVDLIDALRDDSARVVREAALQLQPLISVMDGPRILDVVMADRRAHVQATALQLIFSMPKWTALPWLIRAGGHEDSATAALAQDFVSAWFLPPRCNTVFTRPSEIERRALREAVDAVRLKLEEPFLTDLVRWTEST